MAIQQLMLGVGASKKTYMDEVFSTHLYKGTGSSLTINNGIDVSGEGGLVWVKKRTGSTDNSLFDTETGVNKRIVTNSAAATESLSSNQTFPDSKKVSTKLSTTLLILIFVINFF